MTCPLPIGSSNKEFIPELWAQEGLAILEENMVIANLVHRDFEDEVKEFGDVVNTRRPGEFQIRRKKDGTTLAQQDAKATNVRVPLDQWFYTSFTIKDGEASKSFQELVDIYLRPGMQTIARGVDRAVLGRCHAFLRTPAKRSGRLGALSAANAKDYVLEAREILNVNKAPAQNRNLVLAPASETALLKTDMFMKANERGDGGSALENAILGRILGFETYMDQNVNSIASADTSAGTVTEPYAAGSTSAMLSALANVAVGEYINVAGNDQPTYVSATNPGVSFTLNEPLKYATEDNAVVTRYIACDVNGNYAAGHSEAIDLDGWTVAPQVGQLVAFGTGAGRHTYTVIESWLKDTGVQSVILDRPLDLLLTNDDKAYPGPAGSINMAFHRDALALVTRPLAVPNNAMGVLSDIGVYNDIAMRVTMQYDIQGGGTVVNLDILAGVAVLDVNLCVPFLG